ncbi:hypothetical protein GGP41_007445 [Bipolaris sorokiniana]|uniref:Uncharacterized protein n=1 Tax=Cochliobolus sativus TaxID=45130 RepID=A0A8H6E1G7_COCSA|nr:hypothetical protein GGP41_007445 [Bipolaris sorokiniana]
MQGPLGAWNDEFDVWLGRGNKFGGVVDVALHSFLAPPKRWLISALAHVKRVVCLQPHNPDVQATEIKSKSRSDDTTALRPPHPLASLSHDPAKPLTPFARGQTLRLERPRRRSPPIPISPRLAPASLHPRNTLFLTRTACACAPATRHSQIARSASASWNDATLRRADSRESLIGLILKRASATTTPPDNVIEHRYTRHNTPLDCRSLILARAPAPRPRAATASQT